MREAKAAGLMRSPGPPETMSLGFCEAPANGSPTRCGRLWWFDPVKLTSGALTPKGSPFCRLRMKLPAHPPRM